MYSNGPAGPGKVPFVMRAIAPDAVPLDQHKLFQFTRELIDIDSTSGQEAAAGERVADFLRHADGCAGELEVELWEAAPGRYNVFARRGRPIVVLSTHLDTVPPFFPSREDDHALYGRGACDAKGIVAAQVFAARALIAAGRTDFGLLFVVGEERDSAGAIAANQRPQGARFLVNGEPTESRMIRAGKGVLRLELHAHGRTAHSAYPELGESATDKLLEALTRLRALPLPSDPDLGATTMNLGTLSGGRAPNVVADDARAELLIRMVADAAPLRAQIQAAVAGWAEPIFGLDLPPVRLRTVPGFPTGIVAFGTDIPMLDAWGEPLLFGPGSIHVAHTAGEWIAKPELAASVGAYAAIVAGLQALPLS